MKSKSEKKESKKLMFNDRFIPVTKVDGKNYIAIKPICEALGVQFEAQRIRISEHKFLSQLPCKHMVVAADGRRREMLCLQEKYIYGWICSVNSDKEELLKYQETCYEVLYNHFHGSFDERVNILTEQSEIDAQIAQLEQELMQTEKGRKIQELKRKKSAANGHLKKLDKEIIENQLSMFDSN